jgi:hypothetical protein
LGTWSSPSLRTQRNGGCPNPTGLLRECKLPAAPGETEGAGPPTRWASEEDFFGARHMGPNETTGPSVPPGAGGNVTDAGGPGGTKGARRPPPTWRTEAPLSVQRRQSREQRAAEAFGDGRGLIRGRRGRRVYRHLLYLALPGPTTALLNALRPPVGLLALAVRRLS